MSVAYQKFCYFTYHKLGFLAQITEVAVILISVISFVLPLHKSCRNNASNITAQITACCMLARRFQTTSHKIAAVPKMSDETGSVDEAVVLVGEG
jgi:hypothetical protein